MLFGTKLLLVWASSELNEIVTHCPSQIYNLGFINLATVKLFFLHRVREITGLLYLEYYGNFRFNVTFPTWAVASGHCELLSSC